MFSASGYPVFIVQTDQLCLTCKRQPGGYLVGKYLSCGDFLEQTGCYFMTPHRYGRDGLGPRLRFRENKSAIRRGRRSGRITRRRHRKRGSSS